MSAPEPGITRDEAVAIAARYLEATGDQARPYALDPEHAGSPYAVRDADADAAQGWGGTAQPQLNQVPLTGTWLVYCDRRDGMRSLRESYVVVVSKQTGAVLYAGGAADEG